jgi:4-amino-4-deoxy-L-arabinose transferase
VNKKSFLILAGLFAILYIGTLSFRPLYTPDEPRYAEIARELIVHNDWVVPKLNNLVYFEKPIMGHWLNALSLKAFGENPFAVRFSSAFLALLTALMLGWFVRRFTNRRIAFMTATIYLTTGLVFGIGTYAVLDTPLNFFLTGTLIAFFCACECKKWGHAKIGYLAMAGAFCGGAFLTKGFLAFGFPGIIILAFLLWNKRWKNIFTLPWIPLLFVILTAAPWAIMIHQRDGEFWKYFFWVEHVQRFLGEKSSVQTAASSQHPQPWWFFIPIIVAGSLPWAFLLPQVIKGYGSKYKEVFKRPLLRYAACWVVFPFLLSSASSGKLITYILPCFPGIAILIAFGLNEYFKAGKTKDLDLTLKILCYTLFTALTGVAVVQILFSQGIIKLALYGGDEDYKWAIAAVALVICAKLLQSAVKRKDAYIKFGYFAFAAIIAFFSFHMIVPNFVESKKAPIAQLKIFENSVRDKTILVSYKNLISSVCWAFKRDDVYLYHKAGELAYGLNREDSKHRILKKEDFLKIIKKPEDNVIIIMNSKKHRKTLPKFEEGYWNKRIFIKEYDRMDK